MNNIYVPTEKPEDWISFLAKKEKDWKEEKSAYKLAHCWEKANGFPKSVKNVFMNSKIDLFQNLEMLFAFPEFKIDLPGGKAASQNDIFVIAKGNGRLISIMVEGKLAEPFDKKVLEWFSDHSPNSGKPERLKYILANLNLSEKQVSNIGYQLLHRTVSALLGAEKICAKDALMLVHSFSKNNEHFDDYKNFVELFNLKAEVNSITGPHNLSGIDLYFGWIKDE